MWLKFVGDDVVVASVVALGDEGGEGLVGGDDVGVFIPVIIGVVGILLSETTIGGDVTVMASKGTGLEEVIERKGEGARISGDAI